MDSSSDEDACLQQNVNKKLVSRPILLQQELQSKQQDGMASSSNINSSSSRRQSKTIDKSEPPRLSNIKQLAQDRLKRLQNNLKEKNQQVNKRSHQRNSNASSSRSTTNNKPRSLRPVVYDAWKKPQVDGSSSSSSSSANERLRQLRFSLQQQQHQQQHDLQQQQQHEHLKQQQQQQHQQQKQNEVKEELVIKETNNDKSLPIVPQNVTNSRLKDRLKRLQNNLKEKNQQFNNRSHQRNSNASSSRSTTNNKPRSLRPAVYDAWKKPQALIDASNRLKKDVNGSSPSSSSSANERLRQLRFSLQQQQHQQQHDLQQQQQHAHLKQQQQQQHQQQKQNEVKEELVIKETNNDKSLPIVPQNVTITQINCNIESEPMDWEDDDVSMAILQSLQPDSEEQQLPDRRLDHMYFILDTNVLIHNLTFVKDIPKLIMKGLAGSMIFIPYVVIKELDRLKNKHSDNNKNRVAAIRAIHYLNSKFDESRDIQAQSALNEAEHLIEVDSADDSILNCCLQLKEQVPNSMLITNDNNLRLKAKATSIIVSNKLELMAEYPDIFDSWRN